jgi:hypothetical protein
LPRTTRTITRGYRADKCNPVHPPQPRSTLRQHTVRQSQRRTRAPLNGRTHSRRQDKGHRTSHRAPQCWAIEAQPAPQRWATKAQPVPQHRVSTARLTPEQRAFTTHALQPPPAA